MLRRLLGLICAALLAFAPAFASASVTTTGAGKAPGGGGGGYVGPGDIVASAKAFYGLRAYSAAAAALTLPAVRLQRSTDSHLCDLKVTTAGDLDTLTSNCSTGGDNAATATTWCATGAGSCSVFIWYDQSGSGFDAGGGVSPGFAFNCQNARACVTFSGSQYLVATSATSTSPALTISAVAIRTSGTAQSDILVGTNGVYFLGTGPATASAYFGVQQSATQTDGAWHSLQFADTGTTTSNINVDGVAGSTFDMGSGSVGASFEIGAQGGATSALTGKMSEVGLWPAAFSGTQQTNVCHNQFAYFATSASC